MLGALADAGGAVLMARMNIGAQRTLAPDNARREYRQRRVEPFQEFLAHRLALYSGIARAAERGDAAAATDILGRLHVNAAIIHQASFLMAAGRRLLDAAWTASWKTNGAAPSSSRT